jgi:hypothetical protein
MKLTQSNTTTQDGVDLGGLPKTDRLEQEDATVPVRTTGAIFSFFFQLVAFKSVDCVAYTHLYFNS